MDCWISFPTGDLYKSKKYLTKRDYLMLVLVIKSVGNFVNFMLPRTDFTEDSLIVYDEIGRVQAKALAAGSSSVANINSEA